MDSNDHLATTVLLEVLAIPHRNRQTPLTVQVYVVRPSKHQLHLPQLVIGYDGLFTGPVGTSSQKTAPLPTLLHDMKDFSSCQGVENTDFPLKHSNLALPLSKVD